MQSEKPTDFWQRPLAHGDFVVYSNKTGLRLGRIVRVNARMLTILEISGRTRNLTFEREFDRRAPKNVVRASGPELTLHLLTTESPKRGVENA
jgi:hypothetical protein